MAFGFTVDPENTFGSFVEESGTYNVTVSKAEPKRAQSGNEMVSIDYTVLDGAYKGAQIRYQNLVWDETSTDTEKKSETRFNTMLVAMGVKKGTKIDSIETFAKGISGKKLNVTTEWGKPNNKGKIYLNVFGFNELDKDGSKPDGVKRPAQSNVTDGGFGGKQSSTNTSDPFANDGKPVSISDDDLPF
jgi:hypothetical protein